MEIWFNPENGQVMAVYTRGYSGTVWRDRGFERAIAPRNLGRIRRGHRVTVEHGVVVSVEPSPNPEKPQPDRSIGRDRAEAIDALLEQAAAKAGAPKAITDYVQRRGRGPLP